MTAHPSIIEYTPTRKEMRREHNSTSTGFTSVHTHTLSLSLSVSPCCFSPKFSFFKWYSPSLSLSRQSLQHYDIRFFPQRLNGTVCLSRQRFRTPRAITGTVLSIFPLFDSSFVRKDEEDENIPREKKPLKVDEEVSYNSL